MTTDGGTISSNTTAALSPKPTAPAAFLTRAMIRRVGVAVLISIVFTAVLLAVTIVVSGRSDWWPAFTAALIVAVFGGGASLGALSLVVGKPADYAVTLAMGLSLVRAGVSIVGIGVALQVFNYPPEPTAFMACAYYAVTLAVESVLLSKAAYAAAPSAGMN